MDFSSWIKAEAKTRATLLWEWAGRWDDRLGRLKVLRGVAYAVLVVVAVLVIILITVVGSLVPAVLVLVFGILGLLTVLYLSHGIKEWLEMKLQQRTQRTKHR